MELHAESKESTGGKGSLSGLARRWAVAFGLAAFLLGAPPTVGVAHAKSTGLASEGLVGLGAALSSLVYSPIKVVYAAGGTALSALVLLWTFGDTHVAGPIFTQTVGGDYVVTPAHLAGDKRLEFFGPH